jgi:HK97 family phage prohead protease
MTWPQSKTELHYKTLRITKSPSDGSGWFAGMASTTDLDRDNEKFAPGAWMDSVARWNKSGTMPPLFYNHAAITDDPDDLVGNVLELEDRPSGLYVEAQLDLTNPKATKIYERMLAGTLDSMSVGFAYEVTHVEDGVTVIDSADLLEISLTPVPSNMHARVDQVKNFTSGSSSTSTWSFGPRTDPRNDPTRVLAELAELEVKSRPLSADVDAFVTRVQVEMLEEAVEEARAESWRSAIDELATHTREIPGWMTRVEAGAESADEPETVQEVVAQVEDNTYRGIEIIQVTRDE